MANKSRVQMRERRRKTIRKTVQGTSERPRLAVYRSLKHIYAQVVDDTTATTLCAASSLTPTIREEVGKAEKSDAAKLVGKLIADRCREKGIDKVVFDRGGFIYHGRVSALAAAAREAGLKF